MLFQRGGLPLGRLSDLLKDFGVSVLKKI